MHQGGVVYFRGTTANYPGNPALQRIGITPATTQPAVAAIFATVAQRFGQGVVYIATASDLMELSISEGNVLASLEAEVAVHCPPLEFARRASVVVTAARARNILSTMGISIPTAIADTMISTTLRSLPHCNPEQIERFVREAASLWREP